MLNADIAIVGGGLAGSTAAAMLGRAGIDAILIDPHPVYPPDFRCEKLDTSQIRILEKTGLADAVLRASTPNPALWVARRGHLVDRRPNEQLGMMYDTFVNTMRAAMPANARFVAGKVTALATGAERQTVTLSGGAEVSARLVVVANGLNVGLRQKLGVTREIVSPCHSISIGFDVAPLGRPQFAFPALTYYGERPADGIAYLTLFQIGATMRANLFRYGGMDDPWLRRLRDAPQDTLCAAMPGLRKLMGEFEVAGFVQIRPVDLYVSQGHRQPGVVLVGDAFATSCPAAGTGARKVLMDVERLCNVHIPRWLAMPGMGTDKIADFYDDPVKAACDADSQAKAFDLRSFSIDTRLSWRMRRAAKFALHWGFGQLRQAKAMFAGNLPEQRNEPLIQNEQYPDVPHGVMRRVPR